MKKIILLLSFFMILSFGCMKRDNPLDPYGHPDVVVPQKVSNFSGSALSGTTVKLTWTASASVSGYYIYRSMSMNGKYERVDDNRLNAGGFEEFLNIDNTLMASEYYWYKISAYILVNDRQLEGYRSEPIYVYIPQE